MAVPNHPPEKPVSIPRFFYDQITYKPTEVQGVSLQGQTAIVTGSNTGIGFETSRQLLQLGLSKLVLAVRNEEKGKAAAAKLSLGRTLLEGTIEVWKLDLSIYRSITAFAEKTKTLERLDIVILNVGISPAEHTLNERTGHSEVIQVNYLSTALLAVLLLPVLKAKRVNQPTPGRITFVSSEAASWTSFKQRDDFPILAALDRPGNLKAADMLDLYFVSKLLGQFFLAKLAQIVPPSVVLLNASSPATVHDTHFGEEHNRSFSGQVVKFLQRRLAYTAPVGARMITDTVVNHGLETHGCFLSFQKVVP